MRLALAAFAEFAVTVASDMFFSPITPVLDESRAVPSEPLPTEFVAMPVVESRAEVAPALTLVNVPVAAPAVEPTVLSSPAPVERTSPEAFTDVSDCTVAPDWFAETEVLLAADAFAPAPVGCATALTLRTPDNTKTDK